MEAYTDKKRELSYGLINKDFIQLAHSSKTVGDMATNRASEDDIHNHIMKGMMEQVTGNRDLSEAQHLVDMLD